jgi:hypothetical protein
MFVVDLTLLWVTHDASSRPTIQPLLPYRFKQATIEFVEIETTDHSSSYGGNIFGQEFLTVSNIILSHGVTWDDLRGAAAILNYLSGSFSLLLTDDELFSDLLSLPSDIDWWVIRNVTQEIANNGIDVDYVLEDLAQIGRYGIEDIVAEATIRGWDPIQVVNISSITMVAKYDTHIVLPKEHIAVEDALNDFNDLSLDLVSSPTGEHSVPSGTLFFYNSRNADQSDLQTVVSMAENGTGADILVISSKSQYENANIIDGLSWSGVWSTVLDDGDLVEDYPGNYSEGGIELVSGIKQLTDFVGRPGRDVYNSTTGAFYYDPGDVLVATSNSSALPGGVSSEGFLFERLPPPEEMWIFQNLSSSQEPLFESIKLSYRKLVDNVQSSLSGFGVEYKVHKYNNILKKSGNVDDVLPEKSLKKIKGIRRGLGIAGAFIVWQTYGDASMAYRDGDKILMAIVILDGLVSVLDITFVVMKISKLTKVVRVLSVATIVIGILFAGYFVYQATQAQTALEVEFYMNQAAIYLADYIILAIPGGAILQLIVILVTFILKLLHVIDETHTFASGVAAIYYWLKGCSTPTKRLGELQDMIDDIEEASDWLGERITEHSDNGEIAFFVGGLSLTEDAQDLASGEC